MNRHHRTFGISKSEHSQSFSFSDVRYLDCRSDGKKKSFETFEQSFKCTSPHAEGRTRWGTSHFFSVSGKVGIDGAPASS